MRKPELFVRLPITALLDSRLSRSALVVYAVMIDAADKLGVLKGCTIATIAKRSGLASSTVRRAEAQLVSCGYIAVYRTGRASIIEVLHDLRPTIVSTIEWYESKGDDKDDQAV